MIIIKKNQATDAKPAKCAVLLSQKYVAKIKL
jgi:hypothetical protein